MKNNRKLLKEIEEAKNWIEWNKKFVNALMGNKYFDKNTFEYRDLTENEMQIKSTWIISNLFEQTNQYQLIIDNTKKLLNTI